MHRDIKPENILVLNEPDPFTGQHIIKLLDFGLSKDAGNGSAGKSFVGTPCYLAPEVEFTSKGQGGVYGLSADCWSLGALLHVMLVARFPEFERDRKGIVSLVLPPSQWAEISPQAKDLVRSLMEPNSFSRLTVREVLEHPWLGMFQSKQQQQQLPTPPPSPPTNTLPSSLLPYVDPASGKVSEVHDFVQLYSMNDDEFKQSQRSHNPAASAEASSRQSNHHVDMAQNSVVVKMPPRNARSDEEKLADNALSLGPLLNLQRSIALCFEDALASYAEYPTVATQVVPNAFRVLLRHLIRYVPYRSIRARLCVGSSSWTVRRCCVRWSKLPRQCLISSPIWN